MNLNRGFGLLWCLMLSLAAARGGTAAVRWGDGVGLRAGQQLARGTSRAEGVEATVIDARLRELERLRRELIAEERGG